ncbi:hypothetical protein Sru01_12120 [Sphaerisporangium rufum]|uniref:Tetratricopeptide repeat-containing protein n=1 Tax=Sphaerisporangium rufum TaxID=1381558 RepID=A0A919V3F2_9ACTN|nr:tetratricopeptide repeat protein [Sphaerisporangium rufum]GII76230.1 hypothetical protein Sru01_12120 [Sphaerisporangium rufum]
MTQRARATGLASIVQAAGDLIIYGGTEPYRWARWPSPPAPPAMGGARAQPSELLRAANALIGFTGRDALLARLREWRDADAALAVQLIHGPGGQGKTRLAGQVAALWQREGWAVLAAHHRRDRSVPAEFEVPDLAGAAGVLVVVDYAERWDTADLLTLLADARARAGLPVRVLLLARPAGTWWQSLSGRIQRDLRLAPTREELAPLEQDQGVTRAGLFIAARDRFAELLQVPGAGGVAPPPALARQEDYRLVLAVHMAALAAVLAHERGQPSPTDPVRVSELLLARERDHWEAMAAPNREKPLATTPDAMAQVVYTAILTGRLGHPDGKAALARADIDSTLSTGQLLKDHAVCYPPGPADLAQQSSGDRGRGGVTVLEPLYPDRLGEDFLALSTPGHSYDFPTDPWAEQAPARLLAPPDGQHAPSGDGDAVWVRHGLTTLIEASRRWPHLATTQLAPLLTAHPQLALHAGGAGLAALVKLETIGTALLETIEAALPKHRHIDLDIGIAALTERLAEHGLATSDGPAQQARIQEHLALRLHYAGLHIRALAESQQATRLWWDLLGVRQGAYLPALASSLSNQAIYLSNLGRRDEAIIISAEALYQRRQLVTFDKEAYLPHLANSANNHANRLAEVGRRTEAVTLSSEALDLYRELVTRCRDAYLPDLANSMNTHAKLLTEVGRGTEAVTLSSEAVDLYRELVTGNRDAYLPDLATSLHNHAISLVQIGRGAEAAELSQQALDLYRELVTLNNDAYLPNLANSITNHSNLLATLGRRAEAAGLSRQALDLYLRLAALDNHAYLPGLANAATTHARRLAEVGRGAASAALSEQALGLWRELVKRHRDTYLPHLAISANHHALLLAAAGRVAEAIPLSQEALNLRRELATRNRDAYLPNLAESAHDHARQLAWAGRVAEAIPLSQEALNLRRELATRNRDAYLPDLAKSASHHAALLNGAGRPAEAMPLSHEAVDLCRELVTRNRDAYLPDLADSATIHSKLLAALGRRVDSIILSQEAVGLWRELVTDNRDGYLAGYARGFACFGSVLVEGARFREAITPLTEALITIQSLPEHDRVYLALIVQELRRAYAGDAGGVAEEFRAITGRDVPAWMKQSPDAGET